MEGHRKPSPPTVKEEPPTPEPPPPQPIPPTEKGEVPSKVYEQPPKHWAWDKGVKISHQEYKEFQDFKQFKANQQIEIIKQQREKSQEGTKEGFSNINDDFAEVTNKIFKNKRKIQHLNMTNHSKYKDYYNDKLKDHLQKPLPLSWLFRKHL